MFKRVFVFLAALAWVCARGQQMPKQNIAHHADQLPLLTAASIKALAQSLLVSFNTDPMLTYIVRGKLDKMVKAPTLNVAGTGVFYLSQGYALDECGYLIAKGVLARPGDPFAASALGVYYRDSGSLVHSLQCYYYADGLLGKPAKSPYIYSNIAWAAFYWGDWTTAQTYFTKALAISNNFQPAMEGSATLAYAQGNLQALFKCLSQELIASFSTTKRTLGASPAGPSTAFTSTCSGTMPDYSSDPTSNTTYDNLGSDDDGGSQDPPPGAGVSSVNMEEFFSPIFVNNLQDVPGALGRKTSAMQQATQALENLHKKADGSKLQPNGLTYVDEQGNLVHNHDYSKFLNLHAGIIQLLEQRIDWHLKKQFRPQLEQNAQNAANQFGNMSLNLSQQLSACHGDSACMVAVWCAFKPQFATVGSNFLDIGSSIWKQLYDIVFADLEWFLQNDGAIITRIHVQDANTILNLDRTLEVMVAYNKIYEEYIDEVLGPVYPFATSYLSLASMQLDCSAQLRTIDKPDPFAKVPKHIQEFPDPNCTDKNYFGGIGHIVDNCHTTTYVIGGKIGPLDLSFGYTSVVDPLTGQVKDPIYVQNNNFGGSYSGSLGVAVPFDEIVDLGAGVNGSVTLDANGHAKGYTGGVQGSAGANVGVANVGTEGSATLQIDGDGNITGYSTSTSVSTGLGVSTDQGGMTGSASVSGGVSSTSNYDANGNCTSGSQSISVSGKGSVSPGPGAGGGYFGIQANQNIEVVAGQVQPAQPWTGGGN